MLIEEKLILLGIKQTWYKHANTQRLIMHAKIACKHANTWMLSPLGKKKKYIYK